MESKYYLTTGVTSVSFTYNKRTGTIKNHQTNDEYKISEVDFNYFLKMMQDLGYRLTVESKIQQSKCHNS